MSLLAVHSQGIEFSVTYKESDVIPYEECETLVPNCRVDSHREPCRGQLCVYQTGVYTLLFNNASSRCCDQTLIRCF